MLELAAELINNQWLPESARVRRLPEMANSSVDGAADGDEPPAKKSFPVVPLLHELQHLPGNNSRVCAICHGKAHYRCRSCDLGLHPACMSHHLANLAEMGHNPFARA